MRQDGMVAAIEASARYRPEGGASYSTWLNRRVQGAVVDSLIASRSHGITHDPDGAALRSAVQLADCSDLDWMDGAATAISADDAARAEVDTCAEVLRESLDPLDWYVLSNYFGIDNDEPQTLRDLGESMRVSHVTAGKRLNRALEVAGAVMVPWGAP